MSLNIPPACEACRRNANRISELEAEVEKLKAHLINAQNESTNLRREWVVVEADNAKLRNDLRTIADPTMMCCPDIHTPQRLASQALKE